MDEETQLATLLRGGTRTDTGSFLATVTTVNEETIDIKTGDGTEYFDVQLKAAINAKGGIIIQPVTGSTVLVNSIEGSNRLYVAMFSEINEVIFNKGENGMVRIEKLTEKLNELVKTFRNHVHSGVITQVSGGSGTPAVGTPGNTGTPTSNIENFIQSDYEDTNIKH